MMRLTTTLIAFVLGLVAPAAAETGTIPAADGVPISYTIEGQGEPAIVFIHGWTVDRTHWRFQVPAFRKSYRVVAIDLPGHGASGRNRDSWSIEGLADDVATVVRELKLEQVVLVGHSMGGFVVLAAASKLPGKVRGVVTVDSVHNVEYVAPPDVVKRIFARFELDFDSAWERFMTGFFDDPESEVLESILEHRDGFDRKAAFALLVDYNRFDSKAALKAAKVPVRGINAATPYPTAVEINRKYGDFDAVLMTGVGHFLMLEKPDEFNRHLGKLIEQFTKK